MSSCFKMEELDSYLRKNIKLLESNVVFPHTPFVKNVRLGDKVTPILEFFTLYVEALLANS